MIALLVDLVRREHRMVGLMARTDRLTGLLNRGSFEQALERECARARRYARPLGLICFDLDRYAPRESTADVLRRADEAMYRSKRASRAPASAPRGGEDLDRGIDSRAGRL